MDYLWMRFYLLWIVCYCVRLADCSNMIEHARKRRDATQFYGVIQCHQPDVIVLARFGDYGCSCGKGSYTGKSLDDTDRCCQIHDSCYKAQDDSDTQTLWEWASKGACGHLCVSYKYSCKNQTITCAADNNTPLGNALCECDKAASKCFAKANNTYDKRLSNVDQSIWCSETSNVTELLSRMKEPPAGNETSNATEFPSRTKEPRAGRKTTHATEILTPTEESPTDTTTTHATEILPPTEESLTGSTPASNRPTSNYNTERIIDITTTETSRPTTEGVDISGSVTAQLPPNNWSETPFFTQTNVTNITTWLNAKNGRNLEGEQPRSGTRSLKLELRSIGLILYAFLVTFTCNF